MKKTPKPPEDVDVNEALIVEEVDVNEALIATVRIALGGDFANHAISDFLRHRATVLGRTLSIDEFAELPSGFLTVTDCGDLKKEAGKIVMYWAMDLAAGRPVDDRVRPLVHEWCRRQNNPEGASGRPIDDPLKGFAISTELVRLAETHPSVYGAKKQMYHHLQTKFGLKRSQLSKLLSGFDPWEVKKDLEEFLKNVR
jgi:hypothetical protein